MCVVISRDGFIMLSDLSYTSGTRSAEYRDTSYDDVVTILDALCGPKTLKYIVAEVTELHHH